MEAFDPDATVPPGPDQQPYAFSDHARYEILEEVGRGAMGVVYRGRHRMLDRQVAIKLCLQGNAIQRFQREAILLASTRSPHIVTVFDFDLLSDGRAMLVMDWIGGSDLGRLIKAKGGPLSEDLVVPWMLQVSQGMQCAADESIVHRDLKPSNILIDENHQALVADFGLACSTEVEQSLHSGGILGTALYMASEQAESPGDVDTRADIYSFGATFYHAVTGSPPYEGETVFSILFKHKTAPLLPPKARNPALSQRVNDCLERCLAKAPADRFQTFAEVWSHLELLQIDNREKPSDGKDQPNKAFHLSGST